MLKINSFPKFSEIIHFSVIILIMICCVWGCSSADREEQQSEESFESVEKYPEALEPELGKVTRSEDVSTLPITTPSNSSNPPTTTKNAAEESALPNTSEASSVPPPKSSAEKTVKSTPIEKKGADNVDVAKSEATNSSPSMPIDSSEVETITPEDNGCIEGKYDQGVIAFDTIPEKMYLGESHDVVIQIDHLNNVSDLGDFDPEKIKEDGEAIDGKTKVHLTKIWKFMKIEILAEDPEGLSIIDVFEQGTDNSGFQEITCDMPAEWKFSIKPLKKGKQKVFFNVYVSTDGINKRPFGQGSRSREISVVVVESFMSKYGIPLAGLAFLLLAGGLFFLFKKKAKAEESIKNNFTEQDIQDYQKWLTEDRTERVLESIIEKIEGTTHSIEKEAVLCLSNLKRVKKEHDLGIVSFTDYSQKIAKLNQFVINLVADLSKS